MVVKYGMSDLGPIVFGKSEQMMFLGQEISNEKNYSERVASDIDEQVRKLLIHAHDIAEKILRAHKNALKKIADTLIEKEVLEQDDFNAVLKPFKIKPIAA
jgi:cell division protease FtsH